MNEGNLLGISDSIKLGQVCLSSPQGAAKFQGIYKLMLPLARIHTKTRSPLHSRVICALQHTSYTGLALFGIP